MTLTTEQIALLDQILDQGYASKTVKVLGGKVEVTFKSLLGEQQMKVEALIKDMQSMSNAEAVHTISTKLLAQAMQMFHVSGKDAKMFKTPEDAEKFLMALPVSVLDVLVQAQAIFEKDLTTLAKAENLEANFTPTPSEEQKQN